MMPPADMAISLNDRSIPNSVVYTTVSLASWCFRYLSARCLYQTYTSTLASWVLSTLGRYTTATVRSFVFLQLALSVLSVVLVCRIICPHWSLEAGLKVPFLN